MKQTSTTPNYWIAGLDDEYWDYARENRTYVAQYRYGENDYSNRVTVFLNAASEVREGDILLLAYSNKIYAFGNVQKCPLKSNQISVLRNVINENKNDYERGIVRFADSDVFYEELTDKKICWGQCIKVDEWHYYKDPSNVYTQGQKEALLPGFSTHDTLCGVSKKFAENKIVELKEQYNKNE